MARLLELVVTACLVLVCGPLLLFVALAITLEDWGPVFYRQTRIGIHGREFRVVKFRSMRVNNLPPREGEVGAVDPLVTHVGGWIRRFKIDELPQLFNVLQGTMGLIGPRPTIPEHVEAYTPFQRRRLELAPGMTGWAQVNGGIEISWPERIMLDVWYIDHRSTKLSLKILWRTVTVVLFGDCPAREAIERATAYFNQRSSHLESAERNRCRSAIAQV